MANQLSNNPIVIDTPAATPITNTAFRVQAIVWDAGTSAANTDVCTVKDRNGKVKYSQTILTGNLVPEAITFSVPVLFDGLIVSAITHGVVYIYLADSNNLVAA
jgi:hypothetical protein